ncbi:MAG: MarR family transcriptional regulator [Micromonosporaceae bacterium]|nr:MarR family transcriptional regulator [Micromonosporaceae bacterium]
MICESMGMARMAGRLMGWLLVCDPPKQTTADLVSALGISKGAVSVTGRQLIAAGLAQRVAIPGARGDAYEITPMAFAKSALDPSPYRMLRELMERGLAAIGDDGSSRFERLRRTRDFYAFAEQQLPNLFDQFVREHDGKKREGEDDG